jgi:hypothetical protein
MGLSVGNCEHIFQELNYGSSGSKMNVFELNDQCLASGRNVSSFPQPDWTGIVFIRIKRGWSMYMTTGFHVVPNFTRYL